MATKQKIDITDISYYIANKRKKKGKSESILKKGTELTAELVRQLLHYEPDTGFVYWKIKHTAKSRVGAPVNSQNSLETNYRTIKLFDMYYRLHRVIWLWVYGTWPKGVIDHINGIKSDNRLLNLRDVTKTENQLNRESHRKGRLMFTSYNSSTEKWMANLPSTVSKKYNTPRYLGTFITEKEAYEVVVNKMKELSE